MRGVALADIHLGFSGGPREIGGRNARELDVESAWARAVENTIARQPDLITIAGDIVHHPRVSNHAVKALRDGIRRMVRETGAHVVIIQGNHDAPQSAATCTPIIIPDDYERVYVVLEPTRIPITIERTGERIAIACFPYVALGTETSYRVEPDPDADVNVLLVHAAVKGSDDGDSLPYFYGGLGALDIGREADRWDVVAVGDFHDYTRLHPTRLAFYSGSIERTSTNIWPEGPKGIVAYDTKTGELEFVEHPTRQVIDCDLSDFMAVANDEAITGVTAAGVNLVLEKLRDNEATADAIVRLSVPGFNRASRDLIDWALVRELKNRCLHFQLDIRFAKPMEVQVRDRRDDGAPRTLTEAARNFFEGDRPGVQAVAFRYLGIGIDAAEATELVPESVEEMEVANA